MSGKDYVHWSDRLTAKLERAVEEYNRAVDEMESYGYYDYVPNKTTFYKERQRIRTYDDFDSRISQLNKANDYYAKTTPVEFRGANVPAYLQDEILGAERTRVERRRKAREKLYPNWWDMSESERASASTHANISEPVDDNVSGDDLDDLIDEELSDSEVTYIQNYIDTWLEYCIIESKRSQVVDDIEYIELNDPGYMKYILDLGEDESRIEYIYPTEKSAYIEDVYTRHNAIVDYWHNKRMQLM